MNLTWTYQTPNEGWWANYRYHITKSSEELGLKSGNWKKSFFRSGYQNKVLQVEGIDNAKKLLKALQNGTITAFGGRFRGASYDKNAERIIKQTKKSLKESIKRYKQEGNINVKEVAVVSASYYNWGKIIGLGTVVIFIIGLSLYLLVFRKKNN